MICPKCGRKYEDDMPQCLWCDAPNPKMKKQPEPEQETKIEQHPVQEKLDETNAISNQNCECPETSETTEPEDNTMPRKGTLIFWMGAIFGELGVHCIMSGRTLRGWLYLFFGGFTFNFLKGFLGPLNIHFPLWMHILMNLASVVVTLLACIDVWKIAQGRYVHSKKGFTYTGAKWMFAIAILCYMINGIFIASSTIKIISNGFFNIETYDRTDDNVQACYENMASSVEDYIDRQEKFFAAEKRLGNFEVIAFIPTAYKCHINHFVTQDLGIGISIKYRSFITDCKTGSIWTFSASVQDDKLVWYATMPKDEKCKETFPKFYELKDKLEKQQTESSAQ